jgi:hypothetical protein
LQTAAVNEARSDAYLSVSSGVFRPAGLLVEEARTNSIRNNTMVGAVAGTPGTLPTNWVSPGSVNGLTQQIVGSGIENGVNYIDLKLSGTPSASGAHDVVLEPNTQVAAANGQTWSHSSYFKLAAGTVTNTALSILVLGRDSVGSLVGGQVQQVAFTPTTAALTTQRVASTLIMSSASVAFVSPRIRLDYTNGAAIDVTLRIGLPQLEQGAFASSVILTTAAAATRSADVSTSAATTRSADVAQITGTNFSSWYQQNEGTVLFDGINPAASTTNYSISDGSTNNLIQTDTGTSTRVARVVNAGVTQANNNIAYTYGTTQKFALSYATNSINFANAGVLGTEDTSATIPTVDQVKIGANPTGTNSLNNTIRRFTYWSQRLPNSTLQAITS